MAGEAYRFAFDTLRNRIVKGKYKKRARLPAERDIGEELGVSRITVRHAMRLLEDEGLVRRYVGKGTFVQPIPKQKVPIVNFDYTKSIQNQDGIMSRKLISHKKLTPSEEIRQEFNRADNEKFIIAERVDYWQKEPVAYDIVYIPERFCRSTSKVLFSRIDFLDAWLSAEKLKTGRSVQIVEAGKMASRAAKLLKTGINNPVLLTRDIMHNKKGEIIAVFDTAYKYDRFKLVSNVY